MTSNQSWSNPEWPLSCGQLSCGQSSLYDCHVSNCRVGNCRVGNCHVSKRRVGNCRWAIVMWAILVWEIVMWAIVDEQLSLEDVGVGGQLTRWAIVVWAVVCVSNWRGSMWAVDGEQFSCGQTSGEQLTCGQLTVHRLQSRAELDWSLSIRLLLYFCLLIHKRSYEGYCMIEVRDEEGVFPSWCNVAMHVVITILTIATHHFGQYVLPRP